ncbi:hypothetical protein [Roseobacter sp.]|uniref:hypothetical protein n=1 Tax=Roseobacter sp. TaxID=1907202 RepID=UPI00329886BA
MVRIIAALLVMIWPLMASAQQVWISGSYDNGDFFLGTARLPDGSVALSCGERSPLRPDWLGPQDAHATVTAPGTIVMRFSKQVLGPPRDELANETREIKIVANGVEYQLPAVRFDYFDDGWSVALPANDPFFAGVIAGYGFQVDSLLGHVNVPTVGLAGALPQVIAFCEAKFGDIGLHWSDNPSGVVVSPPPTGAAVQPTQPAPQNDAMVDVAYAHVAQVCGQTPASLGPDHLMIGNIDGDGRTDVVIWWGAIDCGPPRRRPACGAAQCRVDTFLTAAWRGMPQQFNAASVSVARGSDGLDLVQTTGRRAACQTPSAPAECRVFHGWQNSRFQRLN